MKVRSRFAAFSTLTRMGLNSYALVKRRSSVRFRSLALINAPILCKCIFVSAKCRQISCRRRKKKRPLKNPDLAGKGAAQLHLFPLNLEGELLLIRVVRRSEERRVGKECELWGA